MKNNNNSKTGLGLVIGLSLGHGIKHFGQGALTVIGPMLKVSMGLSDVAYGAIFSALNVSSGLSNIPAGILSDMYRRKIAWLLAISMFTIALGYLLLGISSIYALIILSVILIGFGTKAKKCILRFRNNITIVMFRASARDFGFSKSQKRYYSNVILKNAK